MTAIRHETPVGDAAFGDGGSMSLQQRISLFDDRIRMPGFERDADLRDRRDGVYDRLRKGFLRSFSARRMPVPGFRWFDQGSHALGLGVRGPAGLPDLDVGVMFQVARGSFDPLEVKSWVAESLAEAGSRVRVRRPNVELLDAPGRADPRMHLAVYAEDPSDGRMYLALGDPDRGGDGAGWEEADPIGLLAVMRGRHRGAAREQFQRVVRMLKWWAGRNGLGPADDGPIGFGLAVAAWTWFRPRFDSAAGEALPRDEEALRDLVRRLVDVSQGVSRMEGGGLERITRLRCTLPVAPGLDVFASVPDDRMTRLHERLVLLRDELGEVARVDDRGAVDRLARVFGPKFPARGLRSTK
jgi:hypothetical protein